MADLKAIISSTARDLPEHRAEVRAACLSFDVMPKMMEHLPASDADAIAESQALVDEADVYTGVFARRFNGFVITILLAVIGAQVPLACALPQPFTAVYAGSKNFLMFEARAEATIRLERSESYLRYTSRSEIHWSFYHREFYDCSILRVEAGKLYPVKYLHTDSGSEKYRVVTSFDWRAGEATTIRGDKPEPRVVPLQWPTWDSMSAQVAIIDAAPGQAPGTTLSVGIVERGKLSRYELRFKGEGSTDTRIPDIEVFEVVSVKDDASRTLWLAPEHHWVPVKMEIDEVVLQLMRLPTIDVIQDVGTADLSDC